MTALGIIILELYSFGFIPVSLIPDIDISEISVQVSVEKMSARQLEDVVIKPLRKNLIQLSHLKDTEGKAINETGIIRLLFNHGAKIDYSFIEVNEKIDRVMVSFPKTMKRPKVIKTSATDISVFYLSMTLNENGAQSSTNKDLYPVSQDFANFNHFANQVIRKRIEQVDEVAMVDVSGLVSHEILIIPDNKKLIVLGISLEELKSNIKKYVLEIGSLSIKDSQYQYGVCLGNTLNSIQKIKNIYIHKNNYVYQLKELVEGASKTNGIAKESYKITKKCFLLGNSDYLKLTSSRQAWQSATERNTQNLLNYWRLYYEVQQLTLHDFMNGSSIEGDFDTVIDNKAIK